MSNHFISEEVSFPPAHSESTKKIWNTFWLLSIVTIIELVIGLAIYNIHKGEHPNESLVLFFKGMVCILTLAKAIIASKPKRQMAIIGLVVGLK